MQVKYVSFPANRAYGVEMEVDASPHTRERIQTIVLSSDKNHGSKVTGWGHSDHNKEWHVKSDSTCGWEVASFKAKGVDDLVTIGNVANALQRGGCIVTVNCGVHVHVEVADFTSSQVANLMARWIKIEPVICGMLPTHRTKNKYCRLLGDVHHHTLVRQSKFGASEFWNIVRPRYFNDLERRVAMNVCNFASTQSGCKKTVEFRLPEGTLDPVDIKNWIRLFVKFVSFGKKKRFPQSMDRVGLTEALQYLGLAGTDKFFILSQGLRDTKEWLLRRILKFSSNKATCKEAVGVLNKMWSPLRKYELASNCETLTEAV